MCIFYGIKCKSENEIELANIYVAEIGLSILGILKCNQTVNVD